MRLVLMLLAVPLLSLAGCSRAADGPTVELKGRTYTVEIADELHEQARGLMFRRELAPDHGMLFVYEAAERQAYWMRNCHIPLDIMYFDAAGRFINAHYNAPPCNAAQCPSYPSSAPAKYVLELGGGVGKALGIEPGDALTLPR